MRDVGKTQQQASDAWRRILLDIRDSLSFRQFGETVTVSEVFTSVRTRDLVEICARATPTIDGPAGSVVKIEHTCDIVNETEEDPDAKQPVQLFRYYRINVTAKVTRTTREDVRAKKRNPRRLKKRR